MVDKVKMENGNETSNNMEVEPEKPYNILITDDDDVFSEINMAREIIKKCNEDILSTDERIDALIGAESTLT
ncbi:hypothetical protein X943_000174 [Babesia divergens]|uniref:Uncharacterized protein n=1 Tax=Babesia divergens TaxID=32595 RepID=A0AAD9LFP6_BABDI|nr:hypothetical protein X943_000174 [Babesia divergens]